MPITGFLESAQSAPFAESGSEPGKRQLWVGHQSFVDIPANGKVAPKSVIRWLMLGISTFTLNGDL